MKDNETQLLAYLLSVPTFRTIRQHEKENMLAQAFEALQNEPLGSVSRDFLEHPKVISYLASKSYSSLDWWYFIQTNDLESIEKKIKKTVAHYQSQLKTKGMGVPPNELYSRTLIRQVYLSDNPALIDIFKRHLPPPHLDVFAGHAIPTTIAALHEAKEQSTQAILTRTPSFTLDDLTKKALTIQRHFRSTLRYKEEIRRISSRPEWRHTMETSSAKKLIDDANQPYRPRCAHAGLARRIMTQVQHVRLFSTVKHWTSNAHITDVLNDALYGRRHLLQSYLPFRPASLYQMDIHEGDGNVICLGPSTIDPLAMQPNTIELLFDLDKMSENNPSLFFKQRDLGFELNKIRSIPLNQYRSLFFSHTNEVNDQVSGYSYLSFYNDSKGKKLNAYATLPNYALISYNVKLIHQILTLNFFRFLDANDMPRFTGIRENIYQNLAMLSDEALLAFLENIGRQLSDTSEFNIYGAHQIDFSSVTAISSYPDGRTASYTLHLNDLLASLEQNETPMLHEAKAHLPGVMTSYRFLDYLLSKTTAVDSRLALEQLRSECTAPATVKSNPLILKT